MAEDAVQNQYGDITIGGNAVVQLGDKKVTNKNEINIQTAYLFLQDELDLPKLNVAQAYPSLHTEKARQTDVSSSKYHNTRGTELCSYNEGKGSRHTQLGVSMIDTPHSNESVLQRVNFGCVTEPTPEQNEWLVRALSSLHNRATARGQQNPNLNNDPNDSNLLAKDVSQRYSNSSLSKIIYPGQELLSLFAIVLTFLVGRNASSKDIAAFTIKCQHDPLFPFLTATLAFGIARYLYAGHVTRSLSCMDELKIKLLDAYGNPCLVSMSVCADYSIFKSFLEVHYRKAGRKTGEMLIKANQFHLMLGSRRGALMDADNWAIEPGSNIVNSLYVTTEEQKCLLCKRDLIVGKTGDLHCLECKVYFRDYDTLSLPAPCESFSGYVSSSSGKTTKIRWTRQNSELIEYLDEAQIELEGLQYIDIRITPPHQHPNGNRVSEQNEGRSLFVLTQDDAKRHTRSRLKPKSILKPPTKVFPEDPHFPRPGVLPLLGSHSDKDSNIPPGARWTKIDRSIVDPEALEQAKERFEVQTDHVIVLRVLSRLEIQKLMKKTREIREEREKKIQSRTKSRIQAQQSEKGETYFEETASGRGWDSDDTAIEDYEYPDYSDVSAQIEEIADESSDQ